jgi:hypothetical protein
MNKRTLLSYNLRQLQLPREYQLRLHKVKHKIALITGKVQSIETVIMCLIDEFLNQNCDGDFESPLDANVSGDNIDLRTLSSNGEGHDWE